MSNFTAINLPQNRYKKCRKIGEHKSKSSEISHIYQNSLCILLMRTNFTVFLVPTIDKFVAVKLKICSNNFTEFTAVNFGKSVKNCRAIHIKPGVNQTILWVGSGIIRKH